MKIFILIYLMIGVGCAIRSDDEKGPALDRLIVFLVLMVLWPMALGSLIGKSVEK